MEEYVLGKITVLPGRHAPYYGIYKDYLLPRDVVVETEGNAVTKIDKSTNKATLLAGGDMSSNYSARIETVEHFYSVASV